MATEHRTTRPSATATGKVFTTAQEVLSSEAHISICALYSAATDLYGVEVITSENKNPLDDKFGNQGQTMIYDLHLMSKAKEDLKQKSARSTHANARKLSDWTKEVLTECRKHEPYLTDIRASLITEEVCSDLKKSHGWHHLLGEEPTVGTARLPSRVWSFPRETG